MAETDTVTLPESLKESTAEQAQKLYKALWKVEDTPEDPLQAMTNNEVAQLLQEAKDQGKKYFYAEPKKDDSAEERARTNKDLRAVAVWSDVQTLLRRHLSFAKIATEIPIDPEADAEAQRAADEAQQAAVTAFVKNGLWLENLERDLDRASLSMDLIIKFFFAFVELADTEQLRDLGGVLTKFGQEEKETFPAPLEVPKDYEKLVRFLRDKFELGKRFRDREDEEIDVHQLSSLEQALRMCAEYIGKLGSHGVAKDWPEPFREAHNYVRDLREKSYRF